MSNPFHELNVLRSWKPGDAREVPEEVLKRAQLEGRYDSYARIYELDDRRWEIQGQKSLPTGETKYTLVCLDG